MVRWAFRGVGWAILRGGQVGHTQGWSGGPTRSVWFLPVPTDQHSLHCRHEAKSAQLLVELGSFVQLNSEGERAHLTEQMCLSVCVCVCVCVCVEYGKGSRGAANATMYM